MSDYHQPLCTLDVHLDAVARNWLYLKKKLKNGTDCAAVVKADGYGLGALEVSRALYAQGCRHFFVAHVDEAVAVRAVVQDAAIYVLNGPWGMSAADFIRQGFIPVLNSLEDIVYWKGQAAPCVLHLDTGMNRLGLSEKDVQSLSRHDLEEMNIRYVMSHLACADEQQHAKNPEQLEKFKRLSEALQRPFRLSLANSGGIFLGEAYHFDLVRPGCALYGINPAGASQNSMQNTITLKGRVLQTRDIPAGETVGYGARYKIASPVRSATVSIGYADGYLRSLTGTGAVFIHGQRCAVIGRVSMDSIIVDVTACPQPVTCGDWAEIIGPHQSIDDVAAQAGTIGYEILTSIGKRYKRTYTG